MKKGTEIEIEMDESTGSWTAMSPDYPGWECKGTEQFGCGEKAAKDLEEWVREHEV